MERKQKNQPGNSRLGLATNSSTIVTLRIGLAKGASARRGQDNKCKQITRTFLISRIRIVTNLLKAKQSLYLFKNGHYNILVIPKLKLLLKTQKISKSLSKTTSSLPHQRLNIKRIALLKARWKWRVKRIAKFPQHRLSQVFRSNVNAKNHNVMKIFQEDKKKMKLNIKA